MEFTDERINDGVVSTVLRLNFERGKSLASIDISLATVCLGIISKKEQLIVTEKSVGADSSYALPIKVVCPKALNQLFMDNMFRPIPSDIKNSIFKKEFTLLVVPEDKLDSTKYVGKLRSIGKKTTDMIIAIDFDST